MTESEQVNNIRQLGYSQREAQFLLKVALHSGYFIRRQYAPSRGQQADTLCDRVLAHRDCLLSRYNGKSELYHLRASRVYDAIGDPDNRHRRTHDAYYLRGKLMGLDYVIDHPDLRFFASEESKIEHFCGTHSLDKSLLPCRVFPGKDGTTTVRYFLEKYPIYLSPEGKTGLCYLDDGTWTKGAFGNWLERHKPLIQALDSQVEVVYIAAVGSEALSQGAVKEFARVITSLPVEMLRYFDLERDVELKGLPNLDKPQIDLLRTLRAKYAGSNGHYADWRKGLASHLETRATLKTEVLPYSYLLLPKPKRYGATNVSRAV